MLFTKGEKVRVTDRYPLGVTKPFDVDREMRGKIGTVAETREVPTSFETMVKVTMNDTDTDYGLFYVDEIEKVSE